MHLILTIFLALSASLWLVELFRVATGASKIPRLSDFHTAPSAGWPKLSLIFAARDEAQKLPLALASMLEIDYPELEIIAVDDRSNDATSQILDDFAASHSHLTVIHVSQLSDSWLGKPHALYLAAEAAHGEWLVFTDADVTFSRNSLRRAVSLALANRADHLSLLARAEMIGFWEKLVMTFFALGFLLGTEPWLASDPRSKRYIGIGAFQMLRRDVYDSVGGMRRLAMEVVEDMKLGKLVKLGGYRSVVGRVSDEVSVRWQAGLGNLVRGTTKNFFAATGFSLPFAALQVFGLLLMSVFPWIALVLAHGWLRALAAVSVACAMLLHIAVTRETRTSPLYSLTHPVAALIFTWMLVRSTIVTLWRGGIVWRDTFHPLSKLRRGVV